MAAPLSIPPSQYWDGLDGPWSTFSFLVGTPPLKLRLLPSTSTEGLRYIEPHACNLPNETSDCAARRGDIFQPKHSTSWTSLGAGRLPFVPETKLGYRGQAAFGSDNVTLGWQSGQQQQQQSPLSSPLAEQIVAGIAPLDPAVIGSFGLTARPVVAGVPNAVVARPGVLEALRAAGRIPGASWAYTAGSHSHRPSVVGSLVLGGYDAARVVSNNVSFAFGADVARPLLVGVQAIRAAGAFNGVQRLLPEGLYAAVDSLEPHMWLPLSACNLFADAFKLTWDNRTRVYLIGDNQHAELLKRKPNITFSLAPSLFDTPSSSGTVSVVVPYTSLALVISKPLPNASKRYFPLRRASHPDQFTLGRAFMQHAYVIADYDRARFSVGQALLPGPAEPERLVAIQQPSSATSDDRGNSSIARRSASASRRAGVIGGAVGAVVLVLGLYAVLAFFILRCRRRRRGGPDAAVTQLSATSAHELDDVNGLLRPQAANGTSAVELRANGDARWHHAAMREPAAVVRRHGRSNTHELPADGDLPAELGSAPST